MKIYADNAATTRMSQAAIDTMLDCMNNVYGNPSSLYTLGQKAKERLEETREEIAKQVKRTCDENGPLYFFPCLSQGLPISTFPGVYDTTNEEIAKYSEVYWAEHNL